MFSRNASSSRAIPVKRLLDDIYLDPALPIHWGKNRPGMQAREEHEAYVKDPYTGEMLHREAAWGRARAAQLLWAQAFDEAGYHKQVVNRRAENDGHINVVVTATEWANFFKLRLHPDAQPEINELARVMKEAMDTSPQHVSDIHLPYVRLEERKFHPFEVLAKLSSARCARVSYLTHEGKAPDFDADMKLAEQLLSSEHMSPFEHAARALNSKHSWTDNFKGWCSFRASLTTTIPESMFVTT